MGDETKKVDDGQKIVWSHLNPPPIRPVTPEMVEEWQILYG